MLWHKKKKKKKKKKNPQSCLIFDVQNHFNQKSVGSATLHLSWNNFKWVLFINYMVMYMLLCDSHVNGCCWVLGSENITKKNLV